MLRGSFLAALGATGVLCAALAAAPAPAAAPTAAPHRAPANAATTTTTPTASPCPAATPAAPIPPAKKTPTSDDPAPTEVVACVHTTPIYGVTFTHWLGIDRREHRKADGQLPAATTADASTVMQFLISAEWIIGEAAHDHLAVTASDVRATFRAALHVEFPGLKGFHRFLRRHGETVRDLKLRVRLGLLSAKLDVRAEAPGRTPAKRQLALNAWISSFVARWTNETACQADYATPDCGSTLAAP